MTKKLRLNMETIRLLASCGPFEIIATDKTARIIGGAACPNADVPHRLTGPDDPGQTICGHSVLSNCS